MPLTDHMPILERLDKGANCAVFLDGAPEPNADVADIMRKAAAEIRRLNDITASRKLPFRRVLDVAGITPDHPKFDELLALALWGDKPPPTETTPQLRARIRELSTPPRDDHDRAVILLLDDFEKLLAERQPCGECHIKPGERCDICGRTEKQSSSSR
jgi:hypothetical protein